MPDFRILTFAFGVLWAISSLCWSIQRSLGWGWIAADVIWIVLTSALLAGAIALGR